MGPWAGVSGSARAAAAPRTAWQAAQIAAVMPWRACSRRSSMPIARAEGPRSAGSGRMRNCGLCCQFEPLISGSNVTPTSWRTSSIRVSIAFNSRNSFSGTARRRRSICSPVRWVRSKRRKGLLASTWRASAGGAGRGSPPALLHTAASSGCWPSCGRPRPGRRHPGRRPRRGRPARWPCPTARARPASTPSRSRRSSMPIARAEGPRSAGSGAQLRALLPVRAIDQRQQRHADFLAHQLDQGLDRVQFQEFIQRHGQRSRRSICSPVRWVRSKRRKGLLASTWRASLRRAGDHHSSSSYSAQRCWPSCGRPRPGRRHPGRRPRRGRPARWPARQHAHVQLRMRFFRPDTTLDSVPMQDTMLPTDTASSPARCAAGAGSYMSSSCLASAGRGGVEDGQPAAAVEQLAAQFGFQERIWKLTAAG